MNSPKNNIANRLPGSKEFKLPQIHSRKKIQSSNKKIPLPEGLPLILNPSSRKNISLNKENNSQNIIKRKQSIEREAKSYIYQVQKAGKMVNDIFGGLEATINLGGDLTNFQHKIQLNRQLIRKNRHKTQTKGQNQSKQELDEDNTKIKCISSKDIFINSSCSIPINPIPHLKVVQKPSDQYKKDQNKKQQNILSHKRIKSQRKMTNKKSRKVISAMNNNSEQKVFKQIKGILEDPQRIALREQMKHIKKHVKFTIEELQKKLRKIDNLQLNKSNNLEEVDTSIDQSHENSKTLNSVKSMGMIPLSNAPLKQMYTIKNWNKISFQPSNQNKNIKNNEQVSLSRKQIKHCKSDFDSQIDQIQKLQMRSYKSIEKMVQNRKLLVDLKLLSEKSKGTIIPLTKKSEKKIQEN